MLKCPCFSKYAKYVHVKCSKNSYIKSVGIDYLEFLDLDDSESTVEVSPTESELLNNEDYHSHPIVVETGIPIGARSQLSHFLYVSCYAMMILDLACKLLQWLQQNYFDSCQINFD